MPEYVSGAIARTIMSDQVHLVELEMKVPFSRADLFVLARARAHLFHIPAGSFLEFPASLDIVHFMEDIVYEQQNTWACTRSADVFVVMHPYQGLQHRGLMLREQQAYLGTESILSPYEVACLASYWSSEGRGPLFSGQARTAQEVSTISNHVHTYPLTVLMSYDQCGRLRLGRGYASQVSSSLGVLAGRRYAVPAR